MVSILLILFPLLEDSGSVDFLFTVGSDEIPISKVLVFH